MSQIICKWCKKKYEAHNTNRQHCSGMACRTLQINENLKFLENYFVTLLRHKITARVELRLPGNDSFGQKVKVTSKCLLDDSLKNKTDDDTRSETITEEIQKLIKYFKPILQKKIQGNFIIGTTGNGKIDPIILNESYTSFRWPIILGNNLLISKNILRR